MAQEYSNPILSFFGRFSIKSIVILALLLFIGFGVVWWRVVYANPERVFSGMLENSLRLNGVTRRVIQSGSGQYLDQVSWLNTYGTHMAASRTTLEQGDNTVNTESIGTPTGDFVRYTSINTTQTNASGEPLDFSSILGKWGDNNSTQDGAMTNGELYNESSLGIIPFGYLDAGQRARLLDMIRQNGIYEVDYQTVKRELQHGRPRYTYTVKVDAAKYVAFLKEFAKLSGMNHLESLDPEAYAGSEKLSFQLIVDVWSRQLTKTIYSNARVEEFSAHNVIRSTAVPTDTITIDELQTRLQDLQ